MDTVPVVLDCISDERQGLPLARCLYFHVEVEETLDPWQLGIDRDLIPFFMVGLAGIIVAPNFNEPRFGNVGQLIELVDRIEAREGRSVETADIWLPTRLLPRSEIIPGTVLRLARDIFLTALSVRERGGNVLAAFENARWEGAIEISPLETAVIADWSRIQVSEFGHWENREEPPRRANVHDDGGFEKR